MMYDDKFDAATALANQGGWVIYYAPSANQRETWEHTIDEGYMRDLHTSAKSNEAFEHWAKRFEMIT